MKNIQYKILLVCFFLGALNISLHAQEKVKLLTKKYIEQSAKKFNLSTNDIKEWSITSNHLSKKSGINHIYGIQKYNGIEIYNATFDLHIIDDNKVISYHNNFITSISNKIKNESVYPNISASKAIKSAAKQLDLTLNDPIKVIETGKNLKQLLEVKSISSSPIPAKLMYYLNTDNQLVLVWDMSIEELKGENWWSLKIDASSGEILDKVNWVNSCSLGEHEHSKKDNSIPTKFDKPSIANALVGGYHVYPFPIESPNHGDRSIINDPDNAIGSPFGWHDTNGSSGAEFTITRGNNVFAYEDRNDNNSPGFSPDGGSSLFFNFPINTTYSAGNNSEAAAITNLFYWNNICHDIWYQYGFDEASGNFQENNYGNSGSDGDSVNAEAQDGSGTCNANFATPSDGQNPRMQMYVCGNRDGDLDNLVIVHEYGHGISKRLVGGGGNTNVLNNQEQMGEGWSDWFGLMMTIQNNDVQTDARSVGTWLFGENANGPGIRHWPYSTDLAISQYTYGTISTSIVVASNGSVSHGIGSVWASMLWEVTWELINAYGYDPDLYNGSGGNNIAMQLIIEGLKLTPNSPGFVDSRDAILQADQALYNGENQCYIWKAFAKRGLGASASQGSSSSRTDGTEAFDIPDCNECPENLTITQNVNSGQEDIQEAENTITALNSINNNANAEYDSGNTVMLTPGFHAKPGATFRAYIDGCSPTTSLSKEGHDTINDEVSYDTKDVKDAETLKLYPNPTRNKIIVKSHGQLLKWELLNQYGRSLLKGSANKNDTTEIDLTKYTKGMYFVKATLSNGETIVKTVIKE